MLKLSEFDVMHAIHRNDNIVQLSKIQNEIGYKETEIQKILGDLYEKGLVDKGITATGYKALEKYKVKNAIIMAAGFGLRSLPLSRIVPKGLYEVKGEILVERQIRQLQEAGVKEIIVVVGYLKEKFQYLEKKFGVSIVNNDDYYRYNNISSLFAVKDSIDNSYICCSDNYFNVNVFREYVYDSYYSCLYSEQYTDEYCVTKTNGEYIAEIVKGASQSWYTIGEAFFSHSFSEKFVGFLQAEYEMPEVKKMLWDDFHMKHIKDLPLKLVKYSDDIVQEFDTIEDIIAFDPNFVAYRDKILQELNQIQAPVPKVFKKYDDIERYNSAETNQHYGRLHLNENTFGPSKKCLDVLKGVTLQDLYEYDMASEDFLIERISKRFAIPEDDIFIHNGSAEILKSVFSIVLESGDCVMVSNPGWSYYESLAKEKFCKLVAYEIRKDDYSYYFDVKDLLEKAKENHPKLIVITSPHNPTGCRIKGEALELIIQQNPDALILLDEAYAGFSEEDMDIRRLVESYTNLIISRTFSKYYALANIRIGYALCNFKIKRIWGLDLPLFRENTISRRMAAAALDDRKYYEEMNRKLNSVKLAFIDSLNAVSNIRAFVSHANFVPVLIENVDMDGMKRYLGKNGILVRLFSDHGVIMARIAIADENTMTRAAELIKQYVKQ